MSYIWEEYSADKTYIIVEKENCPYIEVMQNTTSIVSVNPMLRFSKIFDSIHNEENSVLIECFDKIENIVFHFLAQLDKQKGLNYERCIIENIKSEILNNYYGYDIKHLFLSLNSNDQETILFEVFQRLTHDSKSFFMDCISKLFPIASLCYETKTDIYYLYLGAKKTDYNLKKYKIVELLFWNINMKIEIIWKNHYGIVGNQNTMQIDSIQVV